MSARDATAPPAAATGARRRRLRRRGAALGALLAASALAAPALAATGEGPTAATPAGAAKAAEAAGASAEAPGPLLRAMREELARSMAGLRIEGMEAPYFIEYAVEDREVRKVSAVLGAVERRESERSRSLRVGVRVGSPELDNSGFADSPSFSSFAESSQSLTLADDEGALRRELWLATDQAYRNALEQLAAKRAALRNRGPGEDADLAAAEPVVRLLPAAAEQPDMAAWERRVRELSAVYRDYPGLQRSRASLRVVRADRLYVNSEGTMTRRPANLTLLFAAARTQAADGADLSEALPVFRGALADLPPQEELAAAIRRSAERLTALASEPVAERYVGPVLLAPRAAAELAALLLLPAFSGERPPVSGDEQFSAFFRPGAFTGRMGRRVLPEFLGVVDDPLLGRLDGHPLFGGYAVDDQGVPARPVVLVQDGVLRDLLMSRRPGFGLNRSNGHARSIGMGEPRATAGNLVVTSSEGASRERLEAELLERCRAEGLGHGLVVESIGMPSDEKELQSAILGMLMGGSGGLKLVAEAAHLLSVEDGRRKPVRGLATVELTERSLLEVAAAGSERHVLNLLSGDNGSLLGSIMTLAFTGSDEQETGVPVSVVVPALLFPELEFTPSAGRNRSLPLVPSPLAASGG